MLKGFLSVLARLGLYMVLFVVVIWGLDTIFPVPPGGPSMGRIVAHVVLVGMAAFGGGMLTASVAPGKPMLHALSFAALIFLLTLPDLLRSEERRVGKASRWLWAGYTYKQRRLRSAREG